MTTLSLAVRQMLIWNDNSCKIIMYLYNINIVLFIRHSHYTNWNVYCNCLFGFITCLTMLHYMFSRTKMLRLCIVICCVAFTSVEAYGRESHWIYLLSHVCKLLSIKFKALYYLECCVHTLVLSVKHIKCNAANFLLSSFTLVSE